ncbi:unnamed protein product [Rotaria magnacalcarata]|uniref:Ion transport domain-containing protein n=5 Tax=Rotaria magnacalcarata TaxID=392030 RepID=A0A815UNM9_9BILA|nr:unnamed protein product [Rotaria magnacalcarata]
MDTNHLTTKLNNNNNNLICPLSPTRITICKNNTLLYERDRSLNKHVSTNVLSNLPPSRNFEETDDNELPFPDFVEKAFYCLKQTTRLRYQCLKLIAWPWFERISMFVILLNCITLGMYQPCEHHSSLQDSKKCDTARCIWLQATDYFIFGYFTIEMCIKMIAMGVFGKRTYLADTWNRLDCFIVVFDLIEAILPGDNLRLSAIRKIRVLRPLRAINRVPSMRILVMLLLDTLPMLGNVLLLCFFVFFVFGIVGVQLWKGLLRNRCFLQFNMTSKLNHAIFEDFHLRAFYVPSDQDSFVCSQHQSSGMTKCSDIPKLRKGNMTCELDFHTFNEQLLKNPNKSINGCINWNQYYKFCNVSDKNPYSGSISFDNIGLAWVVIFQIISLESWVNIMYYIQDAHSFWDWIYFVCLIVIGSFFMINLCLVVIATQFSETKKRETERMLNERRKFSRSSNTSVSDEPGSCWEETIKYIERLLKHLHKQFHILWRRYRQKHAKTNRKHLIEILKRRRKETQSNKSTPVQIHLNRNSKVNSSASLIVEIIHRSNCQYYQVADSLSIRTPASLCPSIADAPTASSEQSVIVDSINVSNTILKMNNDSDNSPVRSILSNKKLSVQQTKKSNYLDLQKVDKNLHQNRCSCYQQNFINDKFSVNEQAEEEEEEETRQNSKKSQFFDNYIWSCFIIFQSYISKFVASKYFRRIVLSAIVINTLSMGIEYHGQPQSLTNALEYINLVFTSLFAMEMILKIIADGCLKYIKNAFNLFDSTIVIMSLLELQDNKNSGLSVLRTFRLLRILKLVRFMPTLRRQLILTQEDWNEVLYNGMENTSAWAALYFIALMTFGNYVLFNLLVAILVEGFSTEKTGGTSNNGSIKNQVSKNDALKKHRIFSNDIEVSANLHELIIDESSNQKQSLQENKTSRTKEVKTMSIPKIAISNENDSILRIVENGSKRQTNSNNSSPYKSIIKTRLSQVQSSSSPSTRTYHTCLESIKKHSLSLKRSNTISAVKKNANYSLHKYYSCKTLSSEQRKSLINPIRQINFYQPLLTGNIIIDQENCIKKDIINSNLAVDNTTYSMIDGETSSIYETPKHENNNQHLETSIRLIIETDSNLSTLINNSIDMQVDLTKNNNQSQNKVSRLCLIRFCGKFLSKYLVKRENYSLYIFSSENRLRKALKRLIVKKSFDYSILFFIALNCITLAMERPSIPVTSHERQFLNITNIIFTIIFTIEMMMKILASGLICEANSYLRNGWNVLDGSLVIISIIDLATMHRGIVTSSHVESETATRIFSMLRVFRLLRTLRPLRVISRAPGLKLVVQTLLSSLRPIGHIVVICCTFFIIFGILGVQLFKGKFYYCEGPSARNITTRQQCETTSDHRWKNQQYNFDNLGQALLTLFVLSSRDGWVQIMYNGIDAVDIDMQPIKNYNEAKLVYFISFLLLVSFFVLNMFVGVVVENFHICRAEQEREEKARHTAKRVKKLERKRRRTREVPYYAHFSPWRRRLHNLCNSKYFDLIIAAAIGLNVITMSLEFYLMPPALGMTLDYCNYVFTSVFIIEIISKIIALGPFRYFKDKWNRLDSVIVVLSIAGIVLEKMNNGHILPINPTLIRAMRVLRIARGSRNFL